MKDKNHVCIYMFIHIEQKDNAEWRKNQPYVGCMSTSVDYPREIVFRTKFQ
jgi:hypothetical protein